MSDFIVAAPETSSILPIEPGTYPAICVGIYDLGEQYNERFEKYSRKVVFSFEIPSETILIDGEELPRMLSETYTASLGEKSNLRKTLESWRGRQFSQDELKGFDLENVLGAPCMLSIIWAENSKGNTFPKISAISRLPKGFEVISDTAKVIYSLNQPNALEALETLPEWIQKRIKESSTYTAMSGAGFTDISEDTPFDF